MAQVFRRYSNTVARVGLFGVFLGPVALGAMATAFNWSPYVTQQNVVRSQPVLFSHQHHVRELGLDCRYCHTSVEDSSFANIPPVKTCMTCHSQIYKDSPMLAPVRESFAGGRPLQWNRVHDLPDFVYFDHSIHVHQGIGCSSCHGRIDEMPLVRRTQPLTMAWCLHCHRAPEKEIRPREAVFQMGWQPPPNQEEVGRKLVQAYGVKKLDDCNVCHR